MNNGLEAYSKKIVKLTELLNVFVIVLSSIVVINVYKSIYFYKKRFERYFRIFPTFLFVKTLNCRCEIKVF